MKKVLLSLGAIAAVMSASAQITITSANMPIPYDAAEHGLDTLVDASVINPGNGGANQTWDFSSVTPDAFRGFSYVDPATTDAAADFPTATVALEQVGQQGPSYTYYRVGADGMYDLGRASAQGSQVNEEEVPVLETPMNYGDQSSHTATQSIYLGEEAKQFSQHDSSRIDITTTVERNVDAWGVVTLPDASYDALRSLVKTTITVEAYGKDSTVVGWGPWTYDPIFTELVRTFMGSNSEREIYEWRTNNADVKISLVEMMYQPDSVNQVPYFAYNYFEPQGIEALNNAAIAVYPNPSTDYVRVDLNDAVNGYAKMYNMNGQVVATKAINADNVTINTNNLPAGTYMLNIYDANGKAKSINKVNVAK